jgi:YHS domain-containing protein
MIHARTITRFLAISAAALGSAVSFAMGAMNLDPTGLALKGHDPVAYLTEAKAIAGSSEFIATHNGATYRFKSPENREKFLKEPARFEAQFGGFCAMAAAQGEKADIDPKAFTIIDGKLYLNKSLDAQAKFMSDREAMLKQAHASWARTAQK